MPTFKQVYEKILHAIESEASKDVPYNLDLYSSIITLKVQEAYAAQIGYAYLPIIREIETYRNQLGCPVFAGQEVSQKNYWKEAYFRTKNELKAKHILIRSAADATPG